MDFVLASPAMVLSSVPSPAMVLSPSPSTLLAHRRLCRHLPWCCRLRLPPAGASSSVPSPSMSNYLSGEELDVSLMTNGGEMIRIAGGIKATAALMLMLSLINLF